MKSLLFLVDFDNFANLRKFQPSPKQHHIDHLMLELQRDALAWKKEQFAEGCELRFRLYGGWYSDVDVASKTDLRRMVDSFCAKCAKICGADRLHFEAADAPLFHSHTVLTKTCQYDSFELNIKEADLKLCTRQPNCATQKVKDWVKNGCDGCAVKPEDILRRKRQKTVDTLIVADAMYASLNEGMYAHIVIVSADYDMMPAIMFADSRRRQVTVFRENPAVWYDYMLRSCRVRANIVPHSST